MLVNVLAHIIAWTLIVVGIVGVPLAVIGLFIIAFSKDK